MGVIVKVTATTTTATCCAREKYGRNWHGDSNHDYSINDQLFTFQKKPNGTDTSVGMVTVTKTTAQ